MTPFLRSPHRLLFALSLTLPCLAGPVAAVEEPPVQIPSRDPDKARSAEENITFGEIQSTQDKRLDTRDRLREAQGEAPPVTPPPAAPTAPAGAAPPAVVDVRPVEPVDIGLETTTSKGGILVVNVREGSSAQAAGLRMGDLIKRIADQAAVTPKDLDETLNRYPPLAQIPLVVQREGQDLTLTLQLPSDHTPSAPPIAWGTGPVRTRAGALVEETDIVRDEAIGWVLADRGEKFVEIMLVRPSFAAAQAGLLPNDVILKVDGQQYTEPGDVSLAVHRHPAGDRAILTIRRGTKIGNVPLVIPITSTAVGVVANPTEGAAPGVSAAGAGAAGTATPAPTTGAAGTGTTGAAGTGVVPFVNVGSTPNLGTGIPNQLPLNVTPSVGGVAPTVQGTTNAPLGTGLGANSGLGTGAGLLPGGNAGSGITGEAPSTGTTSEFQGGDVNSGLGTPGSNVGQNTLPGQPTAPAQPIAPTQPTQSGQVVAPTTPGVGIPAPAPGTVPIPPGFPNPAGGKIFVPLSPGAGTQPGLQPPGTFPTDLPGVIGPATGTTAPSTAPSNPAPPATGGAAGASGAGSSGQ